MKFAVKLLLFAAIVFFPATAGWTEEPAIRTKSRVSSSAAILDIRANVSAAEIYINNVYRGNTPLVLEIFPGNYTLRIEKKGFYVQECEYEFKRGNEYAVVAELKQITGTLHIQIHEPDAQLYVDGTVVHDVYPAFFGTKPEQRIADGQNGKQGAEWMLEVSEGEHTVEVKKFGKQSIRSNVFIFRKTRVHLDFYLQPADFRLTSFFAQTRRFNPHNPGALGVCRFDFSVTAPGNGILEIYDSTGKNIYRKTLPPFTRENQSFVWNGRGENGKILENGAYTAYLKTCGDEETFFSLSNSVPVHIDRSLFYPLSPAAAAGSSSALVPGLRLMPKGSVYTAFTAGGDFSLGQGFDSVPLFCSLVCTPLSFLETACSIGSEIRPQSESPFSIQTSVKAAGQSKALYYGAFLRYGYSSRQTFHLFNETGLSAGGGAAIRFAAACITVSEEVCFGNERGFLTEVKGAVKTGLSCVLQHNFYALGLSASWLSAFDAKKIRAIGSIHCGAEFSYVIPQTAFMSFAGLYYTYTPQESQRLAFRLGAAVFHR